jgi:hypothetical protein
MPLLRTREQIIAVSILILLIFISAYILPAIYESMAQNANLSQPRNFHITFDVTHERNLNPEMQIDLEVRYPHQILIVDDPINISGTAVIYSQTAKDTTDVAIYFQNAQAYPSIKNNDGITQGNSLILHLSPDKRKLVGNTTMIWRLEGTYFPRLYLKTNNTSNITYAETNDVPIIVYPKSQFIQIITNKATLLLACAAYILAFVGAFNIIYNLWTKNPTSQIVDKKNENDAEGK